MRNSRHRLLIKMTGIPQPTSDRPRERISRAGNPTGPTATTRSDVGGLYLEKHVDAEFSGGVALRSSSAGRTLLLLEGELTGQGRTTARSEHGKLSADSESGLENAVFNMLRQKKFGRRLQEVRLILSHWP